MRACIIGNSHVEAVQAAAMINQRVLPLEIDYFALFTSGAPRVTAGRLLPKGPSRVFTNIAGAAENGLDLARYDYILISAGGYWAFRNQNLEHSMFEIRLPGGKVSSSIDLTVPRVVSADVFRATTKCMLRRSMTVQIIPELARGFKGKIYVQPWPLPSQSVHDDQEWKIRKLYGDGSEEVTAHFFTNQYGVLQELAEEARNDVQVLAYPNELWLVNGASPKEYEAPDPWHMNVKYGVIVLQQFLKACGQWEEQELMSDVAQAGMVATMPLFVAAHGTVTSNE